MTKPEPTRLEDRFEADGLHYLGGESRLELLRQADVLLEGGGFTLPTHRCILSKGSKVLAALFESVPPARECSEPAPAKRQRVDDGSGDSLGVPASGTLAACTVLRTPFSDFTKPTVVLLLHLLYNSHRAGRVARFAVGKPSLVSELMRLCDALDAPRALRQLDAGLEAALQQPGDTLDCSDEEEGDALTEPDWDVDSELFLLDTLLFAERWREQCPRWFGAAAARLGACLMDVANFEQTRMPMQALLQQPELLGRVQDPAPAFQFMRNLRASMSGVLKCLYQPNGETSALTTMTQGRQAWQLSVAIPQDRSNLYLTVKRGRGFEIFHKWSGYRQLAIRAQVLSSSGHDVITEHALEFGHAELRGRESLRSATPLVSVADLEDDQKGLLSDRQEIAIQLQVQVTCLDM
ncbi:hypothetical protein COHA_010572 [Chlorella ohadii]|uniref:BTB domain-containing protein n=1 Tax=Chlorella ohadii TaxID=2649997 RepID=A0AAD5DF49_9CHLO|nr:hypothetical protein COHA_010572 [Chlorella ohadii]